MSRILVTGGAGFVGSNLVSRLVKEKHEVIVLDDLSSGLESLVANGAHLMQGSITDEDALTECFSHKPDYVVHMAALFANQNSVDHPSDDLKVNSEGFGKSAPIFKSLWRAKTSIHIFIVCLWKWK